MLFIFLFKFYSLSTIFVNSPETGISASLSLPLGVVDDVRILNLAEN